MSLVDKGFGGPAWDNGSSETARSWHSERPLTHLIDSTDRQAEMNATSSVYVQRFWSKVDRRGPDECWPWLGTVLGSGYGQFWFPPKKPLAHRLAYELVVGPIPDGLTIDHLCYVRTCVNPAHMEPVPSEVNYRRAVEKGRLANGGDHNRQKTHCAQGHPFDEANTYLRPGGGRGCRACNRAAAERSKNRKVAS